MWYNGRERISHHAQNQTEKTLETSSKINGSILMHHRIVFVRPYNMLSYDYELLNQASQSYSGHLFSWAGLW
jgi:hypothetical protein